MEGKKLSSFIKSKKTNTSSNSLPLSSSSSSSTTTTAPLNESINGTSASKESSTTSNNNNNHSQSNELTPEEYAKRNTRQIPAILLEDDVETEHEQYPFDFEKYYYESKEINRETVRELVVIPDETTTDHVQLIPKYNRTLVLPSDYKKGANQYIDDCIDFYYSTNWKTLKGNDFTVDETPHSIVNSIMEKKIEYKALPDDSSSSSSSSNDSPSNSSNGVPPPQPTITTTISASSNGNNNSKFHHHHQSGSNGGGGAVDVSIFQSNSVVVKSDDVDELHMNYLERQLRVQNKQEQHQKSLYSYFTLSEQPPSIVDPPIYQKEKARVILVDCKDLVFKFWEKDEETEPFYCSLYLFDISKKVRVSDVFHFDFINEKTDKLLGANQKTKDDLNATKKAIFTVAKSSQDIYLVLKVEKILMGDLEDQAEPYIKCNLKDKEREKLKEQIRSNCSRLGAYRQAFCWGCVPVFGDEGELGVGENTHFRPLYRYRPDSTDAQMLDSTLGEFSKSASTKKLKVIPGHCTVDMSEVSNYHNLFTSPFEPNTIVYNQSLTPINICQPQPLPVQSSASSSLSTTPSLLSPRPEDAIPSAKTTATTTTVPTTTTPDKLIKEMQEFSSFPRFEANQEYIHNLYIYPESVNFSNRSGSVTARNITCKIQLMENDDNVNFDGMKLIYGRSNNDSFTSKYLTSVTYHSKTPFFYDEIKLKLPINLNSNQHLLFTFYHITCQKSDKENSFDAPIGHAVLPIYANGNGKILSDDVYTLPVAYELPPRYNKDTQEVVRYVDNKKPIFQVRTKLVSSIASTDDSITTFFNVISSPGASSDQMAKAIKNLKNCKLESIAQYFPIVMNQLFRIMTSSKHSHELAMTTFIVIGDILNIVNDINGKVHERYAKFVFTNIVQQDSTLPPSSSPSSTHPHEHQPVYEVLIKTWLELMRFQEHNSENILRFSKFFFTIIFKSMSLSLIERSKREENKTRKGRFVGVRCQLRKLISILRWEASTRVKHTFKLSKELVKSLGHLISSLLSICDRGYVFSIIDKVVLDFDQSTNESETEINELKFEFLRIICQNDFFVQLNLPMPYRIDPSLKLNNVLSSSKHFLSELLNSHISNGLSHKECLVRMDAANSLRDTLIKIEMDTRWQDPLTKQRIVGVFVPYLSSVVSNWAMFRDDSFTVKRNILISFLYLLKSVHPNLIRLWWKEEVKTKYIALFEILTTCTDIFEFVGKDKLLERALALSSIRTSTAKSILEDFYSSTSRSSPYGSKKLSSYNNRSLREKRVDARKSILESYNQPASGGSGAALPVPQHHHAAAKDKRGFANKGTLSAANKINMSDYDDRLESNLATEVGSIIIDTCDDFMYEFERELKSTAYSDVLQKVFQLLHSMLCRNQPIVLVPKLYFALRQFVFKFPKSIFEQTNTFCSDLCYNAIRHCNSPNRTTREEAAAFTYILMRKNFEQARKNFVRAKTQIIIGLSKIVEKEIKDDYYLKKSLDTINAYANTQAERLGTKSFAKQVEDLTKRMHTFVIDNIKINNHKDDPEMVADLYHRIADNNKSNADTRLIWLQGLANFHKKQENFAEAAQCYLHMAALVSEYLVLVGSPIPTINGSAAFLNVNKNALEESNSYIEREDDDNNQRFSIDYFCSLINDAILLLKDADLYEIANLVYKLLLPVYEYNLNYEELAKCHGNLKDIFLRIVECTRTKSRMLGSYYRVGFYGKRFEEMNGQEYVYKEPKITRLVEIKDRLRTLFAKKFVLAETAIQIIEGSSVVDLSKLDENQCYLQITSVTPYFTAEESKSRRTPFEACVNLARFMFETPFTISGAGQGNSVADQYKRKTILTVAKHFPYTKKRIIVTAKQEINLSPIENAIEAVDARYETLNAEIKTQQPNFKTLQQVIQGSVRLQVNAGPQEICRTFFSETAAGRDSYSVEHIQRLKQSLSNFLGACAEALLFNKSNVDVNTPSSIEFQEEMEQGYAQLLVGMEQYQVTPPEGSYHPLLAQSTLSNSSSSSSISASLNDSKDDPSSDINNSSPASSYGFLSVPSRKSITQRLSNSFKKGSHLSDSLPNGAESI